MCTENYCEHGVYGSSRASMSLAATMERYSASLSFVPERALSSRDFLDKPNVEYN